MNPDTIAQLRTETPGCGGRVHLNNAGAALMPTPVLRALREHIDLEAAIGGYEAADAAEDAIERAYHDVGSLIGAASANIAMVENATVAFAGALSAFDWRQGDRILTSRADYVSNQIMYLSLAARAGVEVVRCEELPEGGIDIDSLRREIRHPGVRLVALSWIPTSSGLIQDAAGVGAVCADAGVPYLLDACQAVGQLPIDVAELRCDFLAATARKFLRGPRGIGFLYVSDAMLSRGMAPLYPDLRGADWIDADRFRVRDDARRFENWEFAYALVLGQGAAARYADAVGAVGGQRAFQLAASLRSRLIGLPRVTVRDRGTRLCAIVTMTVDGVDAVWLRDRLREASINTTAQARADAVLDFGRSVTSHLRLSPHYYNTEAEIDRTVGAIRELIREQGRGRTRSVAL
jgi:selenocysteine lyase/cysteine desulfurase